MWLDVVFAPTELPAALSALPGAACAVIDVVRATTSLAVMGERAVAAVQIAPDLPQARAMAASQPGVLLVGEEGGLAPSGFDYSNSPATLAAAELAGRTVVFATTNGTRALVAAQALGADIIITAALRNARAVADFALRQSACVLICAGRGQRAALDDLFTAGTIVGMAADQAEAQGQTLRLTECAELARQMARTAGAPLEVLRRSDAGQALFPIGMETDLPWCAAQSVTDVLPRVVGTGAAGEPLIGFFLST